MRCPTCRKEFHSQPDRTQGYFSPSEFDDDENAFAVGVQLCPACHHLIVTYYEGSGISSSNNVTIPDPITDIVIYPEPLTKEPADEVPQEFAKDYLEARGALDYSPKASAALSRRLLQKVLHEILKIKKKDLSQEIDEFLASANAPSYLSGAIDAIRNIGNFAAHPIKSQRTGEIVDVEEGEAEWLLEVLESLFDFVFVQPTKLNKRREELNQKLRELGKPELK